MTRTKQSRIEEFDLLLDSIEQNYSIFYTLSKTGRPVFVKSDDKRIPTAAVGFDKRGCYILFYFNEGFWDSISQEERKFVVYHEMLHVMFSHGIRTINTKTPQITNQCLDIVVNEMLLSDYGFKKDNLPQLMNMPLCLVENVFENQKNVEYEQSYEYYYGLYKSMMEQAIKDGKIKVVFGGDSLDNHDSLEDFLDDKVIEEIVEKLKNEMSETELAKIDKRLKEESAKDVKDGGSPTEGGKKAGTIAAGIERVLGQIRIVKKRKWETVIRRWVLSKIKDEKTEHWSRENYRLSSLHTPFQFPGTLRHEKKERGRIGISLCLDSSGSCVHLAERFYKAALSIPDDTFDVRLYNFDTKLYPISKEEARKFIWKGGGGTSFSCIEQGLQEICASENSKYPDAIFIATDGYANMVNPQHPDRWKFFLSEDYRSCIPPESSVYMLSDYE